MNGHKATILIIEDDANDRLMLERGFRRVGAQAGIQYVKDGEEAMEYLVGAGQFEDRGLFPAPILILLDLRLPKRSGFEVLQCIRGSGDLRRVPVVVLTSSRDSKDIDRAYDCGANSYLVKPPTPQALEEMLRSVNLYWLILNQKPTTGAA